MNSISHYIPALMYFAGPILVAVLVSLFAITRFTRSLKRAARINLTAIATIAIANGLFLAMNGAKEISPLGTRDNWADLWLFAFAPSSFIFSIVATVAIERYYENQPSEQDHSDRKEA